ncbi:metal/formaldehyde-sensitive transcriptional repressor [Acinetobacter sp. S40]|uniref:metal/formaldehyde-sensitive transcriptional repressor n=1 Tax=unclassified Acinetobacter TaxID=196816 RepID=UPI00190CFFA8|nr:MULTISPECIES: metal/formaldehyde-sensitive transcriptional repressor [unclassified Acinetobacter]MBJ9985724.1 metal/formaldehyde-sensitive transcriptional repressor [Acinetobacter sp. S40]MBK0064124.1 metal/formaldehyde-sensitive transcriptional repressor [Acinetobacter sp. S55]MBK0067367.1 metal/formaldehyde-sensitive transcriptional repressor [Acinetobacter sp. S54]
MSHLHDNRKILNRIKRVQGQMNAVHTAMTNEDVSCIAVLQQVAAIRGAINGLMNELVEQHLKTHVLEDKYNEQELEKFLEILKKYN